MVGYMLVLLADCQLLSADNRLVIGWGFQHLADQHGRLDDAKLHSLIDYVPNFLSLSSFFLF